MATCIWCGQHKPIDQMRHPLASRGKTPSTCHACREAHPEQSWCDFHGEPHGVDRFQIIPKRPVKYLNICKEATSYNASAKRAKPTRECQACGLDRESWYFRGGRMKSPTCRDCDDAHPEQRWCTDCKAWASPDIFVMTGKDRRFASRRCNPCRVAYSHGVTTAMLKELSGGRRCAACGATSNLHIDHDHDHCDAARGCADCVRGWLCSSCNTSEGLLGSVERARMLLAYMEKHSA